MEERIRSDSHPEILAETAGRYGITPADLTELDGFESFIYEYALGDQSFILRHLAQPAAQRGIDPWGGGLDQLPCGRRGGGFSGDPLKAG